MLVLDAIEIYYIFWLHVSFILNSAQFMFLTFWSVLYDQIIWQFSNAIVHRCSLFYLEKLFTLERKMFSIIISSYHSASITRILTLWGNHQ